MATARAVVVRAGPSTVRGTTMPARKAIVHTMIATNPDQPACGQGDMGGASCHASMVASFAALKQPL